MSNKMKIIALGVVIVVGILIYKYNSTSYSNNDLYENMEWGMSVAEVREKSEDLGEIWEAEPKILGEKAFYTAKGNSFEGNKDINYTIMYIFKEDKLGSVYLKFENADCDINLDKFYKKLSKGFDSKYEKTASLDNQESEYEMWESEKSTINLLKLSSGTGISLVYEDIEWLNQ